MAADTPPDDVCLARNLLKPIFESGTPIIGPGHLEDAGMPLNTFDAQTRAEWTFGLEILNHVMCRLEKGASLGLRQSAILAQEQR